MGKSSKKREAEQLRAYRLNKQQEEQQKKVQQQKKIRLTVCIVAAVLAVVLIGVGIGMAFRKESSAYVRMTVSYTDGNGVETQGDIVIRLCPDVAPITVKNFRDLVSEGFYNGLTFHRVVPGFMIQGGDPSMSGKSDTAPTIKGEFSENGVNNTLSHKRGVISMARSTSYNSASSQFFIMHNDNTGLDGSYAAFGYVVEGMETVDGITETEFTSEVNSLGERATPAHPVTIVKAVILEDYKESN